MSLYTIDQKYRSRYASTKTAGSSNIAIKAGVHLKPGFPPLRKLGLMRIPRPRFK